MDNILTNIYKLYSWWTRFFDTREEDTISIRKWLDSQIKMSNGVLQINELKIEDEE